MFGYINIDKKRLLCGEYEVYKGIYCSLCKQMGKEYSFLSRFVLSYDCTFFAMLVMSLQDECPSFSQGRCRFNPFKKCSFCSKDEKALSLASAVCISTTYFKLIDNINDSPFNKRIFYRLLQPFFSHWRKKAKRNYPSIDKAVEDMMKNQSVAESNAECSVDEACHPTAQMLSKICEMIPEFIESDKLSDINTSKRILSTFGYHLGRWIYLIDAIDDIKDDIKHKSFNPFILNYGSDYEFYKDKVEALLNHALSEVLLSYNLLEKGRFDSIINNIIAFGMPIKQNEVLGCSDKNNIEE